MENETKQITKVKIDKKKAEIHYTEKFTVETDNGDKEVVSYYTVESSRTPHEDFVNAYKHLRSHVIDICELNGGVKINQLECTGVHFQGLADDESSKVIIVAKKTVKWLNTTINLITPAVTLDDTEEYNNAEKLDKACAGIVDEAWLYIGGKHAAEPQQELEFDETS